MSKHRRDIKPDRPPGQKRFTIIPKISYPAELPIVAQKDKIIKAIRESQVVIVAGDTGSGKTTQLPKMCLEAGRGLKKTIGCTQPRRIAATAMAARVAEELGQENSGLVGYKIRFRDKTAPRTRIKFMTDGILLAETRRSRDLTAYDTLIIDEAHERSLNIDFLLGYLIQLLKKRPDLKIIISSATIDTEKFASHFDKARIIKVLGRTYPVELRYLSPEKDKTEEVSHIDQAVKAVIALRRRDLPGGILLFMPTERDIRETVELLTRAVKDPLIKSTWPGKTVILPLFGRLAHGEQKKIFQTGQGLKIVVATNVAETSITVPDIRYVVDCGLARISTYNARARTTSMPVAPVSRASCDQRKGRCGRLGPGVCVRLYSEEEFLNRPEFTQPEIRRSDLAEVILRMISLKLGDPTTFPFIDPPARRAIKDGYALLEELGAIESRQGDRLTARGRIMARLPLDPRVARMIIAAREHNALKEVLIIAAALTIRDPRTRPAGQEKEADAAQAKFNVPSSDFLSFLKIWELFHQTLDQVKSRSKIRKFCKNNFLSFQRMREWQDIHQQLHGIIKKEKNFPINRRPAEYDDVHQAILSGFLRNIGLKKAKNIYQGGRGHELMIFPGSGQFNRAGAWIMAAELVETTKLFARTVATIKPEWLEPIAGPLCRSAYTGPRWEKKRGQVVADEKVTLFGLIIVPGRKINYGKISPGTRIEAHRIFIQSALVEGELGGRHNFLTQNLKLIARLENMENRLRQRGFVADDQVLYQFYDQRLADDVVSRNELNQFIKKQGNDDFLRMTEQDVIQQDPDPARLADFPQTLRVDDFTCRLSYRFEPGAADDGVTANLPPDMMNHLAPHLFEWLVPGLLPAKVEFLLKGLPKSIRKQLIPIKQTAREITAQIKPYTGSLYKELQRAIYRRCRLKVSKDDWPELPDHLKMRFCTNDPLTGKKSAGRVLKELLSPTPPASSQPSRQAEISEQLKNRWEKQDIRAWDFEGLPEKITLRNRKKEICGYVYPGLIIGESDRLDLKLFTSQDECRRAIRQGLPYLYANYFPNQFKGLKKECQYLFSNKTRDWALYEGIGTLEQIRQDVLSFILREILEVRTGRIPAEEKFMVKVAEVKAAGLLLEGKKIIALILAALKARRETLSHFEKFKKLTGRSPRDQQRFKDYEEHLRQIIPADFLEIFNRKRIFHIERYCRGLRLRVERAHVAAAKDAGKAMDLTPHEERLKNFKTEAPSPQCLEFLADYRMMLEEFKISLFAQELKTAMPVSAKRLDKKWREIEDSCC